MHLGHGPVVRRLHPHALPQRLLQRHRSVIGMGCAHFSSGRYERAALWVQGETEAFPGAFWADALPLRLLFTREPLEKRAELPGGSCARPPI